MNWNKAKNYTILLFVLVNLCLFGLNMKNYYENRLSGQEVENITAVLKQNDISVETDIPKTAVSMAQLEMKSESYDLFELVNIFFPSGVSVKRTEEFNTTIFKAGSRTLRIKEGLITFEDTAADVRTKDEAEKAAEGYMESLEGLFPGFKHKSTEEGESGISVIYNMYYKRNNCFNSFCSFEFGEDGLVLSLKYLSVTGFTGVKSEVYLADVALYSFMGKMKELYPDESLTVSEIELGFYGEFKPDGQDTEALPYYRIRVKEKGESYLINGYTGGFVAVFNK